MAKTETTVKGYVYTVTSPNGGTVTDAEGKLSKTVDAGDQITVQAPSDSLSCDDDDAVIYKTNFNGALAELGLLGGGANTLPAGYVAADFLEANEDDYLNLPFQTVAGDSIRWEFEVQYTHFHDGKQAEGKNGIPYFFCGVNVSEWYWGVNNNVLYTGVQADLAWHKIELSYSPEFAGLKIDNAIFTAGFLESNVVIPTAFCLWRSYGGQSPCYNKKKKVKIKVNNATIYELLPCIDGDGKAAYYNTKRGETFYSVYSRLIVGLTLSQAAQLGRKLPSSGGSLTLSLPEGYDMDERVVNSLSEAESKGWRLTIQTYAAQTAAATFALRRVWVRKVQDENGSYVASDDTRWHVEWCVDVIGADPESLGYERFRSVDAAVAYWGLEPYEYPDAMDDALGDNGALIQGDDSKTSPDTIS